MRYPTEYFLHPGAKVRAQEFGIIDVENEDLTAEGLIAKMREWQESEGNVDAFVYNDAVKRLRMMGKRMPGNIITARCKYETGDVVYVDKGGKRTEVTIEDVVFKSGKWFYKLEGSDALVPEIDLSAKRSAMDKMLVAKELIAVANDLMDVPPMGRAPIEKAAGFDIAFKEFLADVRDRYNSHMEEKFPNNDREEIEAMEGKRYIRVIKTGRLQRFAYFFVDKINGDILKSAGWSAPAKHARGNIFDKSTWKNVGPYGAFYLR